MSDVPANNTALPRRRARRTLADLARRPLNFDLARLPEMVRTGGWHQDDLRQPLEREVPGEPTPDGPWQQARAVMIE